MEVTGVSLAGILAVTTAVGTVIGDTMDWKGVTWTIGSGTSADVATNGDGSITLTADADGQIYLTANLPPALAGAPTPWVEVSYWDTGNPSHLIDAYICSIAPSNPCVGVGSLWMATKVAVSRVYTNAPFIPANRGEQYAIFSSYPASDRTNVQHTAYVEKRADGIVGFRFDSDAVVTDGFVKAYLGGNWGFDTVDLRLRGAGSGDSATFTDFRFGASVPGTILIIH